MLRLLLALLPSASAQWLDYPSKGIPRTADGKPNLTAPELKGALIDLEWVNPHAWIHMEVKDEPRQLDQVGLRTGQSQSADAQRLAAGFHQARRRDCRERFGSQGRVAHGQRAHRQNGRRPPRFQRGLLRRDGPVGSGFQACSRLSAGVVDRGCRLKAGGGLESPTLQLTANFAAIAPPSPNSRKEEPAEYDERND
jgi:hypothetical protein